MSTGLLALLDDVAGIAKLAAASVDDVAAQATKAGAKAAGVVIDDAAVTPRYVVGFAAAREIPIVRRIAIGSLRNKMVFILPAALLLSAFAPWLITPLLVLGGAYLCYEGAEKVLESLSPHAAHHHEAVTGAAPADPAAVEEAKIRGAIRTDLILSAEIMAIALAEVASRPLLTQAAVLGLVGIAITVIVYGAVALIVKADDAGLAMAQSRSDPVRLLGRSLVLGMPPFLKALGVVGTAAMLWVGGGIIVHGLAAFGLAWPEHAIEAVSHAIAGLIPFARAAIGWLAGAASSGLFGLAIGAALIPVTQFVAARLGSGQAHPSH